MTQVIPEENSSKIDIISAENIKSPTLPTPAEESAISTKLAEGSAISTKLAEGSAISTKLAEGSAISTNDLPAPSSDVVVPGVGVSVVTVDVKPPTEPATTNQNDLEQGGKALFLKFFIYLSIINFLLKKNNKK